MKLFSQLFAKRQKADATAQAEKLTAKGEYLAMLARVSTGENLSPKDSARFEQLLGLLGVTLEVSEAHAATLRRVKELEPLAGDTPTLEAALADRLEALEVETLKAQFDLDRLILKIKYDAQHRGRSGGQLQPLLDQRDALTANVGKLRYDWQARAQPERDALSRATAANAELAALRQAHPFLFGEVAATARQPAAKRTPAPMIPGTNGNQFGSVSE